MRRGFSVFLLCLTVFPALCQPPASKYQVGSITAVNAHPDDAENGNTGTARYDISVKIGDTAYVVLYTASPGTYGVQQAAGHDLLVLVGIDTITFNDLLGRRSEVPILRREALPAENDFALAQLPGRYYTIKFENLSRKLNLTPSQQAQLKPILEQEIGELGEIRANPVLSLDAKVRKLESVVSGSDGKLKPLLSAGQWQTLQNMRKDQRQELRKLVAAKKGR
jgi:hypothetical protein